jgi:hypothetical protein
MVVERQIERLRCAAGRSGLGNNRDASLRGYLREGAVGAVEDGLLPGEVLPAADGDFDIGGAEFDRVAGPAGDLGGNDRGPIRRRARTPPGRGRSCSRSAASCTRPASRCRGRWRSCDAGWPRRWSGFGRRPNDRSCLSGRSRSSVHGANDNRRPITSRILSQMMTERTAKPQASRLWATVVACRAPCQT